MGTNAINEGEPRPARFARVHRTSPVNAVLVALLVGQAVFALWRLYYHPFELVWIGTAVALLGLADYGLRVLDGPVDDAIINLTVTGMGGLLTVASVLSQELRGVATPMITLAVAIATSALLAWNIRRRDSGRLPVAGCQPCGHTG